MPRSICRQSCLPLRSAHATSNHTLVSAEQIRGVSGLTARHVVDASHAGRILMHE